MSVVIIDHEDSFTYNIVELLRKAGQTPEVVSIKQLEMSSLAAFDKFILSPGPGLPENYHLTKQILNTYKNYKKILGICLGHQIIAQNFGAKVINLNQVIHGQNKQIITKQDTKLFQNIPATFNVGLYHSWIVSQNEFPKDLKVTAQTKQGGIMAIAHRELPIFGVQFHPESYISEYGLEIIKNFLDA